MVWSATETENSEADKIFALYRNKFEVEGDVVNSRWNGSASCKYRIRAGGLCLRADSRHDLLLGLWGTVSDQQAENIVLSEQHLQGSLVQQHIRELWTELKQEIEGE